MDAAPLVILIVDYASGDQLLVRQLLARTALAHAVVREAEPGAPALAAVRQSPPDCVLLDQNSLASLAALRVFSDVPVLLLADSGAEGLALEALQHGAQDYLGADELTPERLQRAIQRAIATVRLARERDEARAALQAATKQRDAAQTLHLAISQTLHPELDPAATLRALAQLPLPTLADGAVIALCDGEGTVVTTAAVAGSLAQAVPPDVCASPTPLDDAPPLLREVLRTGAPRLLAAVPADLVSELGPPPPHCGLLVPLRAAGQPLGVLQLFRTSGDLPYTAEDLALAEGLARRGAEALAQARLREAARAAQQTAAEALARLEALITSLPSGIAYLDHELRYQLVNPALAALNGRTPEEHVGHTLHEILPGLAPRMEPLIRQVLATGEATPDQALRGQPCPRDGEPHDWLISAFPVRRPAGAVSGVGVTVVDITAARRTEQALRASQQNLAALIDNTDGKIWSLDTQYRLIVGNALFQREVSSASGQEVRPGMCLVTLPLPPEALEQWRGWYDRALAGERFSIAEQLRFAPEPRTVEYRFSPIRDAAGEVTGVTVFGRDITERLRAEQALRDTERKLGTLFELLPVGVSIFDAANTLVYVNPALEQILRMDRASLMQGAHMARPYFRPDGTSRPLDELVRYRVLREHQAITNQVNGFLTEGGEAVWVNVSGVLVDFPDWRAVLITADITQRKQAEDALQESETRHRTLFEIMAQGVVYYDAERRVTTANPAAQRILGLSPQHPAATLYEGWESIYEDGTALAPTDHPLLVALTSGQEVRDLVLGVIHPALDGRRWLRFQVVPHCRPGAAAPTQLYTIFEDITEQRQARQTLEDERQQFAAILSTMYEGVIAVRLDGTIVLINPATLAMHGLDPGDPPATLAEFVQRAGRRAFDAAGQPLLPDYWPLRRVLRGERFIGQELRLRSSQDDQERWQMFNGAPVYAPDGTLIMGVVTSRDITAHKQAELTLTAHAEALSRTNAELAQELRLKDEFLAMMSHELRTPLNVVLGMTDAMLEELYGPLSERQRQAMTRVDQSGRHLLAILSDILDLAHLQAGNAALDLQPIEVDSLCRTALHFVQEAARQKQIRLLRTVAAGAEGLRADARRLTQILVNLLDNAVKFTPAGGSVGLEVTADAAREAIQLAVWDTGIGIAEADFARLFQPFTQVDGRLSRQYSGIGLGLSLVRRLVDLHGGSISLESTPGQGSRFTISLPWAKGDNLVPQPPPAVGPRLPTWAQPPRIVLADDHEPSLAFYGDLLTAQGCQVTLARTGGEALAQVRATRPDVVVLDIQMPELDGLTAIRQIRADAALAAVPIIALTALAMPGDRERCLAAGANVYLAKPVSLPTLLTTISTLLRRSAAGDAAPEP